MHQDALAKHRRAEYTRQARRALPHAVRRGTRRAQPHLPVNHLADRSKHRRDVGRMVRLLLLLLGMLTAGRPGHREAASYPAARARGRTGPGVYPDPDGLEDDAGWLGDEAAWQDQPGPLAPWHARPVGRTDPGYGPGGGAGPRRRRISPKIKWAAVVLVLGLIFRRAIASVVLTTLSAALHLVGINAHLPNISFAWPGQTV